MKAFTDKGRLSQLLVNMPVRIILEPRAALMAQQPTPKPSAAEIAALPAPPPSSSAR